MKDVRDGGNVDESRFPGYTQRRRSRRWLRALAAACLALTMAGGSAMMASGTASVASAHVLAPNKPCSVLPAASVGRWFCLKADAGLHQVQLTWNPSTPVKSVTVYQGDAQGNGQPAKVIKVTHKSAVVPRLADGMPYYFWLVADGSRMSDIVSATPVELVTVPGAPVGPAATAGDAQVSLSWHAPVPNGGPKASGYNVYQGTSPGGESDSPVNSSLLTSTNYTVTGLTNGSTYYFTVKAVNAQGPGAASGEVPATPVAPPEAPTLLTAAPGDRQVTLTWSAPASDGGSKVSGYHVYSATSADFQGAAEVQGVTGTALVLVGLVNGTTYHFRVTAVSKAGEGPPSNELPSVPLTVPGAPTGLTAAPGDRQVALKWDAPASDGGSPVTGYDLYVGTTAHFGGRAPLAEVTGRTVIVTGLVNGTTYYFRVTAVSKAGQGPPSNEVPAVPLTVPGAPTRLTATPGNSKATLAWTAPASGGAPIKGYIIYQGTSPGGETGTPVNGSLVTGTRHTVTGLTNGTTYFFKVVAVNAAGLSPLSAEASAKLHVIVPPPTTAPPTTAPPSTAPPTTAPPSTTPPITAPTGLTATAGNTQVHLSWTAPTSDGGSPVAGYKIYVARVPGVQELPAIGTAKTTEATVTKLSNQAVYYFMVTAVNTAGNESPLSTEISAKPVAVIKSVPLSSPRVPPQLIALITAVAATAAAGVFTLITRGRARFRSRKHAHSKHSRQEMDVGSDVRAIADVGRPDAVSVRDTGQEPTHTIRLEPHPGVSTTTIKEGRP